LIIFVGMKNFAKKLLAAFSFLVLISSVSAQTYSFVGGAVQDFYPDATGSMDCAIHIKNESSSVLKLKYKKVSVEYPAKWEVSFCDNVNCSNSFSDTGVMFDIPVGDEESSLKISTFPNGFADTAIVKYAMWDINAPSKIDTMVFNIYVRWGVGLNSLSNYATIFPNPSVNTFNIQSNTAVSGIEMLSLTGVKMPIQYSTNANGVVVNTSGLVAGVYNLIFLEGDIKRSSLVVLGN
jgi:hypothetical protein